jgi:hypothetical protein
MFVHKIIPNLGRPGVPTRDHLDLNLAKLGKGTIDFHALGPETSLGLRAGFGSAGLPGFGKIHESV